MCGSFEHATHEKVLIADMPGKTREDILDGAAKAATVGKQLDVARAQFASHHAEVCVSADGGKADAVRFIRQLRQAVTDAETLVNAQVDGATARKLKTLESQIAEVLRAKEAIVHGVAVANTTAVVASPAEFAERQSVLVAALVNLCNHGVRMSPKCGTRVQVMKTKMFDAALKAIVKAIVVVNIDTNPEACTADGAGIAAMLVDAVAEFVVTAVDFDGQRRTEGGDVVELALVKAGGGGSGGGAAGLTDRIEGTATDRNDGTYACSITATTDEGRWALEVRVGGVQIQGSPFAVKVAAGVQFVYSGTPFNTCGVLYWIGTGEGARGYENPHGKGGGVVAAMSSIYEGERCGNPLRFVQHGVIRDANHNFTNGTPNSWMSVDLGASRLLAVNHYCLRPSSGMNGYEPRNWRLEGSNDNSTWTVLKNHTNDQEIANQSRAVAAWAVTPPTDEGFRYFRILQHGANAGGTNHLCCKGIELYGTLK
jgi:hypothetical protein